MKFKLIVVILSILSFALAAGAFPLTDSFEPTSLNWNFSGSWGWSESKYLSPSSALTDSPGGYYANNTDSSVELSANLDLSTVTAPAVSFYHLHFLETGYDFGTLEISTDGGSSYEPVPLLSVTGQNPGWTREQVDLDAYAGQNDIRLRFRMVTDSSVVMDGWYIDDLHIGERPDAVVLQAVPSANKVDLSWSPSAASDFAAYRIYRSATSNIDWQAASLLTEITSSSTTTFTDVTAAPKTHYYYRVMVLDSENLHALSNEVDPVTPAGSDYPFLDDGEGGAARWSPEAVWALSGEVSFSATHAWSDSPGTNYADSVNSSLQLAAPLNLTTAVNPVLCFVHTNDFLSGDSGNAEVSTNGLDWTSFLSVTGQSTDWQRERFSLSAFAGSPSVYLRFRVSTGPSGQADGWHIDDISVAESPAVIDAPLISDIQSHSMRLSWNIAASENFSHYAVYRGADASVDFNSTLVATVTDRTNLTVLATGLALDTDYYFRVYTVNVYGTYSPDGTSATGHTLNNPIPFSDDFEGSLAGWNLTGTWGADDSMSHGGTMSLGDSPRRSYSNNVSSSAQTAVDLSGSDWPLLKFYDRYQIAAGDYGYVDVSPDGTAWYRRYLVRDGSRPEWKQQLVDLSEWKNETNLRIRFNFYSDSSAATTADGWNIDDVEIVNYTPPAAAVLPFVDGYEDGAANWLNNTWAVISNDVHRGTSALQDKPNRSAITYLGLYSVLGREFDLSTAVTPYLTYWIKGSSDRASYSTFRWQVSDDGGVSWSDVSGTATGSDYTDWTRFQASLDSWKGKTIRLRAQTYTSSSAYSVSYSLDDVAINEQTPNTALYPPVPHLKSMDLKWEPSPISDFKRVEIYRDTSPNVDLGDVLVGSFTNAATTNLTDTGLSIGQTYYYRLFVVNSNDCYSTGLEQFNTTVPIRYPLTDDMETIANWDVTGNWGLDTLYKNSGNASFGDSPGAPYAPSQNSYILTAVDLSGSDWPLLKFYDRYQIAAGDYGYVDVSPDGTAWYRRYLVRDGSRPEWKQQLVDLSEWKNETNLRIRFNFYSDSSAATTADGWNIDDVEIVNYTPPAAAVLPFVDGYEDGAANWLNNTWAVISNDVHRGTSALQDKPNRSAITYLGLYSVLGREFDLSTAVTPYLTYWIKGSSDRASYSTFRWQVSDDGGVSWSDVSGTATGSDYTDWTRFQASLDSWKGKTIRLRAQTYTSSSAYSVSYSLDDVAINEQTPNTALYPPVPHLKSMDLKWEPSPISDFKRVEIYRDTSPNVDLGDVLVGSFTNAATTNLTDTGLSIGQTYYYRLFVVNSNDCYSTGLEQFNTTVPIRYPLTDDMETIANWDVTGNWGLDTLYKNSGNASFGDSPGAPYAPSQNSYILTAVDLSGSDWPLLKFYDRYQIAAGDYGYVDVSPDGTAWYRRYLVRDGSRPEWKQQLVDLSEWKNETNLRIRFNFYSDSSAATTADGWNIDDVEIVNYTPPAAAVLPFVDGYEDGAANWLNNTWAVISNDVHRGTSALQDKPNRSAITYLGLYSVLGREFDLSTAVTPYLTYWIKGSSDRASYSTFRWQVSDDGGVSWSDVSGTATGSDYTDWTRFQASLDSWKGKTIRLRAQTYTSSSAYSVSYSLDDVAINEQTPNTALYPPVPHLKSMDLKWEPSPISDFKRVEIYRDTSPNVDLGDVLVGSFTNAATTNLTDTGLSIGQTYYYRLFVVNSNDCYSTGNEQFAYTVPIGYPLIDDMESVSNWYATGSWGIDSLHKHSGSSSIGDSPNSSYGTSEDSYLLTSVDLSGSGWPVLKFYDRYQIAGGDYGYVDVSPDGTTWSRRYLVRDGSRSEWKQQTVDLSEWKTATNLRIRFNFYSDGGTTTTADGWNIDDVEVIDYTPPSVADYPFFEDYEDGATNWLNSSWAVTFNDVHRGTMALQDKPNRSAITYLGLYSVLGREFDLTTAVTPYLTYWIKGSSDRASYSTFRWQVSDDGGVSWSDVSGTVTGSSYTDWTRFQASLDSWKGKTIRLRAQTYTSSSAYSVSYALDDIGVGEPAPGTPIPLNPQDGISVTSLRPILTVRNAIDAQGDELTYEFEVFTDLALSNRVANVPSLASGVSNTSWQVDLNLLDNQPYWWRCRAHDGATNGSWSTVYSLYVNNQNLPPNPVRLYGPPRASILHNLGYELSWFPTTDPDLNDTIVAYHIQIADNPVFMTPVVDDSTVPPPSSIPTGDDWVLTLPLSELDGSGGMARNTIYYWRIRAVDEVGDWSEWSTGDWYFEYGTPPIQIHSSMSNGMMRMRWALTGAQVQLQHSSSLTEPEWEPVGSPIWGNAVELPIPTGTSSGFYRLIVIE